MVATLATKASDPSTRCNAKGTVYRQLIPMSELVPWSLSRPGGIGFGLVYDAFKRCDRNLR